MPKPTLLENLAARKKREAALSREYLLRVLTYNSETGELRNAVRRGRSPAGYVIGSDQHSTDHVRINFRGQVFLAHRVIWFMVHGVWPSDQLDHRDKDKRNNRLDNLREATDAQNRMNMPMQMNNRSGHVGVSWSARHKKWRAVIQVRYRQVHLGWFGSIDAAVEARAAAKPIYHGF